MPDMHPRDQGQRTLKEQHKWHAFRFLLKVTSLATTTDWGVPLRNLVAELKFLLFLLITFGRCSSARGCRGNEQATRPPRLSHAGWRCWTPRRWLILEVEHRRLFLDVPAKGAKLDLTLEVRDRAHAEAILASLAAEGYEAERIASGRVIE
jgi:hypothetical protein